MLLEAVAVRLSLSRKGRPVGQLDDAVLDIGSEHLAVRVAAAIVVKEEALDAKEPVELQPLAHVACLVAVDRAQREVRLCLPVLRRHGSSIPAAGGRSPTERIWW